MILHSDSRGQYLLPRFGDEGDFGCPALIAALSFTPISVEQGIVLLRTECSVYNYKSTTGKGHSRECITSTNAHFCAERKADSMNEVEWKISLYAQFTFNQSPSKQGQVQFSASPLHTSTTNKESIDLRWSGDMETYLQTGPAAPGSYIGLGARVPEDGVACLAKWQLTSSHPYFDKEVSLLVVSFLIT
jgi:hypothetical protein